MKKYADRWLRLGALALMLLLLAGCAQQPAVPQMQIPVVTRQPDQAYSYAPAQNYGSSQVSVVTGSGMEAADLSIGYVAAPGSDLHPLRSNSRDLNSINHLVFESVVELDERQQPVPLLADRWEYDQTEQAWIFYLREGIVFHDGSPLTAYDVIDSMVDIQMNELVSPYADRIKYIQEMTAIDDHTLRVVGNGTGYMTLYAMTFPVVQRYSISSELPRGTGPYWYIRYDSYTMLRLERNPLWWKRQPYIGSINCVRYDETSDALTAISMGEIDVMATRGAAGALSRQLSDRMTLDYSTVTWECLVPNLEHSILSDLTVRKAIMYAIDRTTLADNIYLGMAQESEVPVHPGSWLHETQSTQYDYSPERAYQMLKGAGWNDSDGDGILDRIKDGMWEDLAFTLVTYNEPGVGIRQEAANLLAEQLGRVGIRVEIVLTTKNGMRTRFSENTFDMALVGFNLSELPDLSFLLKTGASGNCSEYSSTQMDRLLNEALAAMTPDALKTAMSGIQMQLVEDLPVVGLFFRTGVLISKQNMGGLTGIRETHTYRGIEFCRP